MRALLDALEWYVRNHDKKIEDLSSRIESPEFIEAIIVAVDKSLRTSSVEKVKRFATVLGYELIQGADEGKWEDAAAYIRILDEIGEADIKTLSHLYQFQAECFKDTRLIDYNVVFGSMAELIAQIDQIRMSRDEFYSRCARLGGYGLVLNVERRADIVPPDDYSFRLTEMGKNLMDRLQTSYKATKND